MHPTQYFSIIFEWLNENFHIFWIKHIYMNWIIHFEIIETIIPTLHIALLVYIETHITI
jgi:hypothetical protein